MMITITAVGDNDDDRNDDDNDVYGPASSPKITHRLRLLLWSRVLNDYDNDDYDKDDATRMMMMIMMTNCV